MIALTALTSAAVNNVCARAPVGVDHYADLLLGWVKYGVAAVIITAGFISVGAMVIGRVGSMSRAAQMGASGLVYSVLAAVAYVTIYGILWAIVGKGC
jgi:hypothetical protein